MTGNTQQIKPVYAVISADRFLRGEALDALTSQIGEVANPASRHDGPNANLADVLDEARTFSLLGGRSVVVVEDADKFITENRASLERYCADPAESGTLILLCKSMSISTRLYKIIVEHGQVIHRKPLSAKELPSWASNRAKSIYGKRLGSNAAYRLREHIGDAPGAIDAELAKLSSYVGDRPEITVEDIAELTGQLREEKAFAVIDAIANADAKTALAHWEQVLATNRAAPGIAVGGLAYSIRKLLEARIEFDGGTSPAVLSKKLFASPDVVRRRLERCDPGMLKSMQRDLLAADLAVKTGGSTVNIAVEKFIVKYTTQGKRPSVKAG